MKQLYLLLSAALIYLSSPLMAQSVTAYTQELDRWHKDRIEALKAPDGWLNLAGLYWLEEGRSSFGSNPDNKIVFPKGTIAATAGFFERKGGTVSLIVASGVEITSDGRPVTESTIFDEASAKPPVLACGSLRWTIIRRDDKIGIRLRDLNNSMITSFKDIDRYPVDTAWRIEAVFQPATVPGTIAITNVIGQTSQQRSPGKLVFTIHNTRYTLDALDEGDELFIIFADGTNGKTTYPSGRFLYATKPSTPDNTTILDFNKAYDPPCAFTPYATCPLPPRQNVLPIEVEAGEKDYGHHVAY